MDATGKKLIELMFKPNESACVSYNEYGYHSVSVKNILNSEKITLIPTESSCVKRKIPFGPESYEHVYTDQLTHCALNPIKGYRSDENVKAYRNFLIEMDTGTLKEQYEYIKKLGLPYSAVVFSGNKSLHFLVSLDVDLPSEETYRITAEWILGICTVADQKTKNPSRSIRIPGSYRTPTQKQRLVEIKGKTKLTDLLAWLKKNPGAAPERPEKRNVSDKDFSWRNVPEYLLRKAYNIDRSKGRNNEWFAIACGCAIAGAPIDKTIEKLGTIFIPERGFGRKEWLTTIKSAYKKFSR